MAIARPIFIIFDYEKLLSKNYKFNKPTLDNASWSPNAICMEANDAFEKRLTFREEI